MRLLLRPNSGAEILQSLNEGSALELKHRKTDVRFCRVVQQKRIVSELLETARLLATLAGHSAAPGNFC